METTKQTKGNEMKKETIKFTMMFLALINLTAVSVFMPSLAVPSIFILILSILNKGI